MTGNRVDDTLACPITDQRRVTPAEFLRWIGINDLKCRFALSIEDTLDRLVTLDPEKFVMKLSTDRINYRALSSDIHFFRSFPADFVGDKASEIPTFDDGSFVASIAFGRRRDGPFTDDSPIENAGYGRSLPAEFEHDSIDIGGVTDQTVIARSGKRRGTLPTLHTEQ
jgi:hypothetical protein